MQSPAARFLIAEDVRHAESFVGVQNLALATSGVVAIPSVWSRIDVNAVTDARRPRRILPHVRPDFHPALTEPLRRHVVDDFDLEVSHFCGPLRFLVPCAGWVLAFSESIRPPCVRTSTRSTASAGWFVSIS